MPSGSPSADITLDVEATRPASAGADRSTLRPLERGRVVGRYVIIEPIGMGGMGIVYAAYDPDLDRRVALKLLTPEPGSRGRDDQATARLLREAQAMARLNHPNVVTVHDVGTVDGDVFIAMEYLDGGTLGSWRTEAEPGVEEIVERYVRAGRGLAAAHEAGLVHRDFKPDNVLLGHDGRVRVCDFGLARDHGGTESTELPSGTYARSQSQTLTRTGALVGTPAYMAPEQHRGQIADARTDQFSYCVSLFEALAGRRPWAAATFISLAAAVTSEPPTELPSSIPQRLRAAIKRGLSQDPAERWPSMEALLAALESHRADRRGRWWVLGLVATAGISVGVWRSMAQSEPRCTGGPARLTEAWSAERASSVAAAIEDSGPRFAKELAPIVTADLDRYADRWVEAYADACRATHVLGEQSESLLDKRMSCLERRLVALDAIADVLARADADTVASSASAVASLPSLEPCSDTRALLARVGPPPDPETAAAVDDALSGVARAEALRAAGRYDEAVDRATAQVAVLERLGYEPALAEALLALGNAYEEQLELDQSVEALERGFRLALASGDDRVAAELAAELVFVEGYSRGELARGQLWAGHADALVQRVGSDPYLASKVLGSRGTLSYSQGRLEDALAKFEQALELRIAALGEDHGEVWKLRANIAAVNASRGDFERALPQLEAVIASTERRHGVNHPDVAGNLVNYSAGLMAAGRDADGRKALERALEIRLSAFGPEHVALGDLYGNLGASYFRQGRLDRAEHYFRRAYELASKLGKETEVATALAHLANLSSKRGDEDEAVRMYVQALEIQRREMGVHPFIAITLQNLSAVAYRGQRWEEVLKYSTEAVDVFERSLGPDTPRLHPALYNVGVALRELGNPGDSVPVLERALALMDPEQEPIANADTSLQLARSLWEVGQQTKARELAAVARDRFIAGEDSDKAAEASQWLQQHPG